MGITARHKHQPLPQLAHLLMTVLENQIHTRNWIFFFSWEHAWEMFCLSVPRYAHLCFFLQDQTSSALGPAFNNRIRCWKLIWLHRHKLLRIMSIIEQSWAYFHPYISLFRQAEDLYVAVRRSLWLYGLWRKRRRMAGETKERRVWLPGEIKVLEKPGTQVSQQR